MNDTTTHTNGTATAGTPTSFTNADDLNLALQIFDAQLKLGEANQLGRAILIADREKQYLGLGNRPKDFVKDTVRWTGFSPDTIQKLRRIGRIPQEVQELLHATKIANRQDLLLKIADAIEGFPQVVRIELGREFVHSFVKSYEDKSAVRKAPKTTLMKTPLPTARAIAEIAFPGIFKIRLILDEQGRRRIIPSEVAVDLGLGPRALRGRVKRSFRQGELMMSLPSEGGMQATQTLDLLYLPALLLGIEEARVKPEIRSHLHWLKEKLYIALYDYSFGEGPPEWDGMPWQVRRVIEEVLTAKILQPIQKYLMSIENMWEIQGDAASEINRRLTSLERRTFALIPQLAPEDAGYSMESMNKVLIEKGYNISEKDTAIRSIAAKLALIGDTTFGFWNIPHDQVTREYPKEHWRFNDDGMETIKAHAVRFCELKMQYEAAGETAPREKALQEVLEHLTDVGTGDYQLLTRDRKGRRAPFSDIIGPHD